MNLTKEEIETLQLESRTAGYAKKIIKIMFDHNIVNINDKLEVYYKGCSKKAIFLESGLIKSEETGTIGSPSAITIELQKSMGRDQSTVNGWESLVHLSSGKSLSELRAELKEKIFEIKNEEIKEIMEKNIDLKKIVEENKNRIPIKLSTKMVLAGRAETNVKSVDMI